MSEGGPTYPVGATHFGTRLGFARRELGNLRGRDVSKAALGEHVGVSGQQVGLWESGENLTDIITIERIAQFLRVNPGWLAFGVGPMTLRDEINGGAPPHFPPTPMQVVDEKPARRRRGGD